MTSPKRGLPPGGDRDLVWRAVIAVVVLLTGLSLAHAAPSGHGAPPGHGARATVKIGVSLALTGPDARWGLPMLRGVELAVEDVNRRGGAGGHELEIVALDSADPALGGISRWRGMNNYERFIADPAVIATIGPQTSGEGRAVAPLLSRADLATITPSATTFDITDPALRDHFRPGGRTVYFRTVGTDLAQGEAMARFAQRRLGVRRLVVIDDGTGFGVRTALTFVRQAADLGITVLARRQVSWAHGNYRPVLEELRALDPQALYFAGEQQVGLKIAQQMAHILPSVPCVAAESLYDRAFPVRAGAAAEGWYVSNVAPDPFGGDPETAAWAERFRGRFGDAPSSYSLTAYVALTVIAQAMGHVAASGGPLTRSRLRAAIQATRLPRTPQGIVSFDANGDLEHPVVSIYQIQRGAFHYIETVVGQGAPRAPAAASPARP